ncbi:MAG: SUMF1/EgtB/PvdO family nonheme iron enzyme [Myxococcales bacterium]|nr:SUMF1/EgtB/PvdO family nonheme iron enzyme [Myxococcales bacterium]
MGEIHRLERIGPIPLCRAGYSGIPEVGEGSIGPTNCLSTRLVTVGEYLACVAARACPPPGLGPGCSAARPGEPLRPINCVSFENARAFCRFREAEIPQSGMWPAVGRAGDDRRYPWGNEAPTTETCWSPQARRTLPCEASPARPRSAVGVEDLVGNLRYWTTSLYIESCGSSFRERPVSLNERCRTESREPSVDVGIRCGHSER